MSEPYEASFEPFVTITLAHCARRPYQSQGGTAIALASNCPGVTAIHWYDALAARRLVAGLQILIDKLDPPPVATDKILGGPQRKKPRAIRAAKPKKARKAKRK